jgi:hypothetical protein
MTQNLLLIQKEYLQRVWLRKPEELEASIPARRKGTCLHLKAFGEPCELYPEEIILGGQPLTGPEGILIAMYASHVPNEKLQLHPLKSFKQFPGSMAYQGAFTLNAEKILIPYVPAIKKHEQDLVIRFSGHTNLDAPIGDFSFTLFPLPRIALYYTFYLPDDEFPAAVTCLFPSNATKFMPLAGLADTAEFTARKIIELVGKNESSEENRFGR